MTPLGIRLNNPGNIRHGSPWQGLDPNQTNPSFCTFISPEWGIRAIAKIMRAYGEEGIETLPQIITRWAPPIENDTNAYFSDVLNRTGIDPLVRLDLNSYSIVCPLVKAIIHHENGEQPYSDDTINNGLALAGVIP
jgi:hypothetical protein